MQLSIDNLTKVYPDGTRALDGLSFDVSPGEGVVILGHNGCGKSTLMKCLTGLEPTSGRLSLAGLDLTSASRRELRPLRQRIGCVFQKFNMVGNLSVLQNVLFGLMGRRGILASHALTASRQSRQEAMEALERVGLAHLAARRTGTLSGGLTPENLSLRHFEALFANRGGALQALSTSLGLAIGAALLTGVLGALVGYLVVRARLRGRGLLDLLSLLPNTMPGIVVAVGLILAWNQAWWPIQIYNTGAMLLLAYACLLLPYPVRYASAAFRQMGESLEAAARVCGAGFFTAFRRILLPALAPSLIVSMLLVFAIASRELVASLMVAPAGMRTVSTFVFGQFEQGSPGVGMAMSAVAIFTTTALLVALTVFSRRRLPITG